MPMREITVESKTRVTEKCRAGLYDTKFGWLHEEDGKVRLLAYFGKRMSLAGAQLMELPKSETKMKDAA